MSQRGSTKCQLAAECPRHWRSGPNSDCFFRATCPTFPLPSSVSLCRESYQSPEAPKERDPGVSPAEDSGHYRVVLGRLVG